MAGHHLIIQHLVISGVGVLPTIPNPTTLTPDDAGWVADSDILIGQHAYNRTDNKWYYRSGTNTIEELTSSAGGSTNFSKVLFVDPNGNDTTGTKGDITKPFVTIEAAVVAASTGDTIEVMPGSYTPISNLAKNGVTFYFHAGAIVTKTTSGAIFDYSANATYTSDINILGYGSFFKTSTSGEVFTFATNTNTININIVGNIFSSNTSNVFNCGDINTTATYNITANTVQSSGGYALYCNYSSGQTNNYKNKISINNVVSTSSTAIYWGSLPTTWNLGYVSGAQYGMYLYSCAGTINAIKIIGTTRGLFADHIWSWYGCIPLYLNVGYINSMESITSEVINTGYINYLLMHSGWFFGGYVQVVEQNNGILDITLTDCRTYAYSKFNAGVAIINLNERYDPNYSIIVNGGNVTLNNKCTIPNIAYGLYLKVLSGRLVINGDIYYGFSHTGMMIKQTGGNIELKGNVYNASTSNISLIEKTGGTLILNGAKLIRNTPYQQFINCPSSAQNIMVYSGGVTTNGTTGDLLSAKARKDSLTVTAVATTTIVLNDGSGGAETFTEADTTTYNTTALMAQRMVALINASGTLAITASYVATNNFTIEADVAGTDYTQSGLVNLVNTQLRLNSFAITNLTPGAVIIEDSDVTY